MKKNSECAGRVTAIFGMREFKHRRGFANARAKGGVASLGARARKTHCLPTGNVDSFSFKICVQTIG